MTQPWSDLPTNAIHLDGEFYINNNSGSTGQIIAKTASGLSYINPTFSGSTGIKVFNLALCNTTLAYNFGGTNMCFGGLVIPTNDTTVSEVNFYVTQVGSTGNVQAAVYDINNSNLSQATYVTSSGIQSKTLVGGKNTINLTPALLTANVEYYIVLQFLNNGATIAARNGIGYSTTTSAPNLNFKLANVNTDFSLIPTLNVSDFSSQICPWLQLY